MGFETILPCPCVYRRPTRWIIILPIDFFLLLFPPSSSSFWSSFSSEFLYRWRISNVGKEEYSWIINLRGIIKKKFLRNYSKPFPEFQFRFSSTNRWKNNVRTSNTQIERYVFLTFPLKTIISLLEGYYKKKKRRNSKNLLISFHRYFINPFTGIINGTSDWNVDSWMF